MNGAKLTESQVSSFRESLLSWYHDNRRDLPWRRNPSLYKTVVSEFMLQQTQVTTVLGHFERWISRFPDFHALAAAPDDDVLKHWEGLGYYSRARNLHRLAKSVSKMDSVPRNAEGWMRLPGVGPYTAAAVTSIAFAARSPCVDGNVVRILTRLQADAAPYRDSSSAARTSASLAAKLLDPAFPGDHNQAMMELGATVCVRRRPLCTNCPVRRHCRAFRQGDPASYPKLAPKPTEKVRVARLWCRRGNDLLLHKIDSDAKRLAGLYEIPEANHLGIDADCPDRLGPVIAKRRRGITRFQITETIHRHQPEKTLRSPPGTSLEWVPLDRLPTITLSGPHRKWVNELIAEEKRK